MCYQRISEQNNEHDTLRNFLSSEENLRCVLIKKNLRSQHADPGRTIEDEESVTFFKRVRIHSQRQGVAPAESFGGSVGRQGRPQDNFPTQSEKEGDRLGLSLNSYTLPARVSIVPQSRDEIPTTSDATLAEIYHNNLPTSWQTLIPPSGSFHCDPDGISESFGSYESFNSLALTINTEASSVPDSFTCPDSSGESFVPDSLRDLYLPGESLLYNPTANTNEIQYSRSDARVDCIEC